MSEELPLSAANAIMSDTKESTKNAISDDQKKPSSDHRQRIFAERFSALMDGFGEACETNQVTVAVAIAIHPDEEHPVVFTRGNLYENARLLTRLLRILKKQIDKELEC